jgi:hypothetical protein
MQCEHLDTLKTTFSSFGAARTKFKTVLQLEHCTMWDDVVFLLQSGHKYPKSA